MKPFFAAFFALSFLLAGCADTGSPPATVSSSEGGPTTTAATPTVDEESASLTGLVLDDEEFPVSKARVGIVELKVETVSDADGRFTFNGLLPGTYTVFAGALG